MATNRLNQQIQFILEIDKLKNILRQTLLLDKTRQENSAEHSWHLAMMAMILAEYAPEGVDLFHAIKLLLIHDLVEIDAGDTFCYDQAGNQSKADRETQAAERIFGLLPPAQCAEVRALWDEFEEQTTVTAKFAAALDRVQPMLHNQHTQGHTWKQHGIKIQQVFQRMAPVKDGAPDLWPLVQAAIEESIAAGYIVESA